MEPADKVSGVRQPNGSYSGLMGLFERKEIDLIYSGFAITTDRSVCVCRASGVDGSCGW